MEEKKPQKVTPKKVKPDKMYTYKALFKGIEEVWNTTPIIKSKANRKPKQED